MRGINPDSAPSPLFVLSERYENLDGPWHRHRRAQFVYASDGVLTTRMPDGLWVVPPRRALWILSGQLHKGSASRQFRLKTLYAEPGLPIIPKANCVVSVDGLLDALLSEAATFGMAYAQEGPEQRLMQVIMDRLPHLETLPSFLPMPQDARLLAMTARLEDSPADQRGLEAHATESGITPRTATRLFVKETGLTFAQWRQQLRLLRAMQALSMGESVTNVSNDVGYADTSAFIKVFKATFGQTPARYFRTI
jgi:AraC-like DNA-binding protein